MARLTGDEIEAAFRDGQLNRDWEKQDNADKQRWWVHGHAREMDHEMEHQAVVASDAANARVASLEAEIAGLWQVKAKPNESYFDATMRDPQMRRTYCEEAVIAERVARIDAERDALRARVVELESERDDWKELHAGAHQSWQGLMERVSEHDSRRRAAEIEARDAKGRVAELEAQLAGKGTGPLCAMCGHQDWQHHSDGYLAGGPVDWGRCRARTCNCEEYEAPSSSPAPEAVHATPHADSQVRSKSVLRREAVQRGEPVPGDGPGPTYLPGFQHPPAPPPEPKEVPGPVAIGINLPGEGKGEPGPVVPFERYPPPEGECERCGSRGFVWPVTVVPIDGPVGRIDLLCGDCAKVPKPKGERKLFWAPTDLSAALETIRKWERAGAHLRADLDAANARVRGLVGELELRAVAAGVLEAERDALRLDLDEHRAALEQANIDLDIMARANRGNIELIATSRRELAQAREERDAANARIAELTERWKRTNQLLETECNLSMNTTNAMLKAQSERDAALASAAELREVLAKLWQYVNLHCGDWYMDAERRTIATLIEGPGGALSAAPSDYAARLRAEARAETIEECVRAVLKEAAGKLHESWTDALVDCLRNLAAAPPSPTKEPSR